MVCCFGCQKIITIFGYKLVWHTNCKYIIKQAIYFRIKHLNYMFRRLTLIFFLSLSPGFITALAQQKGVSPETQAMMNRALDEMEAGKYAEANVTFRKMLASKKVLPTNMSYFFAETLYMINQFHNSENFVNKYLKLAGKGGDYYDQAVGLQKLLENKKNEIKECNHCNIFGYRLKECQLCAGKGTLTSTCYYCKGIGRTNCLTCQGDGVIITKNIFGVEEYKTCHVCETKGFIMCKVCHGHKVIDNQCPDCLGSKLTQTDEICDHRHHDHLDLEELDNQVEN